MKKYVVAAACLTLLAAAVSAQDLNKEQKRLEESGVVLKEVLNIPDNIPHDLLEKAECVIVFPSLMKAAFVVGAEYGRGAMVCRTGDKFRGRVGSSGDVCAGRRQFRFPNRGRSHGLDPAGHER